MRRSLAFTLCVVALCMARWAPAAEPPADSGSGVTRAQEADPPKKKKKKKPAPEAKPEEKPAETKPEAATSEPIDPQSLFADAVTDDRVISYFEQRITEVYKEKPPATLVDLRKHIDREKCVLALPAADGKERSPEEVFDLAKQSTIVLAGFSKKEGSLYLEVAAAGIVLTADGVIVTNFHVLETLPEPEPKKKKKKKQEDKSIVAYAALTWAGGVHPVTEILAANEDHDVAILKVEAEKLVPLPLGEKAPVGSWIGVLAHPDYRFFTYSQGHVTRYYRLPEQPGAAWLAGSADIAEGSSGGPAVDRFGRVVGMVAFTEHVYAGGLPEEVGGDKPTKKKPAVAPPPDQQMVVRSFVPVQAIRNLIDTPPKLPAAER